MPTSTDSPKVPDQYVRHAAPTTFTDEALTRLQLFDIPGTNVKSAASGSEAQSPKVPLKNSSGYSHEAYAKLVEQTVEQINSLSRLKGGEYAGDTDRLANFRRNAAALGLNLEDVWAVYAGKHWDAIQQYVKDLRTGKKRERLESIAGRADDLIVYCILFKAILEDRSAVNGGS